MCNEMRVRVGVLCVFEDIEYMLIGLACAHKVLSHVKMLA